MRGSLRGLPEVKTLAGAGSAGTHPKERHVLQFKIGCLELERSRRLKEKTVALDRIQSIEARMAVIDAEIRKHHENLGYAGSPSAAWEAGGGADRAPGAAQARRTIRYGG